ncbi:S1 RNA-binding domain-containing protein [Streptomyces sp. 5.8]|uniref:S1 RNA-binding domain-containing protein n=1 Tax=Streptomyces sp. 5.8 TaxID=3406571 RepID=UPI003BB50B7E
MTDSEPTETLHAFFQTIQPGEVRTGRVTGFDGHEALVDLEATPDPHHSVGCVLRHELSWKRTDDPSEIFQVGQVIEAEVIGIDWRKERVMLSAKACEDRALRSFLVGIERGAIVTGTVAGVHNFGVFVHLDGEPAEHCTGFIRVPDLTWSHINHAADVVEVGQRVTAQVIVAETRQGQVTVSLKALQEDPLIRFADQVGEVVSGRITKLIPFGVFVRVADGIDGLVHISDLSDEPVESPEEVVQEGDEIVVRITEVDLERHRVRLTPALARP